MSMVFWIIAGLLVAYVALRLIAGNRNGEQEQKHPAARGGRAPRH